MILILSLPLSHFHNHHFAWRSPDVVHPFPRLFHLCFNFCLLNQDFTLLPFHFSKVVHLCFIMSPGKMIFAVLEL